MNPATDPTPAPGASPPPAQSPSQSPALTPSWAETSPDIPESPKLPDMTIKSEETPPPTPTTPGVPKKTNWPAVLLAVLLVFALGGVGILAIQNYQLGKQIENLQVETKETPVPTLPPMPTPTADPTSEWKTYDNKNVAYTFKYPADTTLNEGNEIIVSKQGSTQKQGTELSDGYSLQFSLPFKIEATSLQTYVQSEIEKSEQNSQIVKSIEKITVNGVEGYTYTAKGLGTWQYIYLQSKDKVWTVRITSSSVDPNSQGYQTTVDMILSTFKFLEVAPSPAP